MADLLYEATPSEAIADGRRHWADISPVATPTPESLDTFTIRNACGNLRDPTPVGVHVYVFETPEAANARERAILRFQTSETLDDPNPPIASGWAGVSCGRLLVALPITLNKVDHLDPLIATYHNVLDGHVYGPCRDFAG